MTALIADKFRTTGRWEDRMSNRIKRGEDVDHPRAYAQRLVRYIRDASTVRARIVDDYGRDARVPSIQAIQAMRAAHERETVGLREWIAEPKPGDELDFAPCSIAHGKRTARVSLDVDPVDAKPEPKPVVLSYTPVELPTAGDVIRAAALAGGVYPHDITSSSRLKKIQPARYLAAAVLRARGSSYPRVGRLIGGRDHSSIITGVRQFFAVHIHDPAMLAAWMRMAPKHARHVRTYEELMTVAEVRK